MNALRDHPAGYIAERVPLAPPADRDRDDERGRQEAERGAATRGRTVRSERSPSLMRVRAGS